MMTFLGSAVGDPRRRRTRSGRTRSQSRPETSGWCAGRGSRWWTISWKQRRSGCGARAARARVRGVARARRSVGGARRCTGLRGSSCGRGRWELAAELRRARVRPDDPVRARGAVGPPADRHRRRPPRPARRRARHIRSGRCSSARSSSGGTRPYISGRSASSHCRAATCRRRCAGSPRPRRSRRGSAGATRAAAGGSATRSRRCSQLDRVDDAVRVLDAWEARATARATSGRSRM